MEEANDPEARVHVLVQLKTDMSALNEMDGESHFVGRDVAVVFVRPGNL